jgi:hypothetical protein
MGERAETAQATQAFPWPSQTGPLGEGLSIFKVTLAWALGRTHLNITRLPAMCGVRLCHLLLCLL